jgi:RNA polymerase sigma factor (sigma-70 family)
MHGEAQDELIRTHVTHVRNLARAFRFSRNATFCEDDLVSAGFEALCTCAAQYDPARGEPVLFGDKFWAYAFVRVRGAMRDAIRRWYHWDRRAGTQPELPVSFDSLAGDCLVTPEQLCTVDVMRALEQLPPKERDAMFRSRVLGESQASIGVSYGVSNARISQIVASADRRLKALGYE